MGFSYSSSNAHLSKILPTWPIPDSPYVHDFKGVPRQSCTQVPRFRIPDTLRNWPWPRHVNPHYEVCKTESSEWCRSFEAFSPSAQIAFDRCDFGLLASLSYPLLNKGMFQFGWNTPTPTPLYSYSEGCRVACDLVNLFFVIDEHSDAEDGKGAKNQAAIVMDALRNPNVARPAGEWIGGEMARQFWENAIRTATPTSQRRFIAGFQSYLDAVAQQAEDRSSSYLRDIRSYFNVRRHTIGVTPSLAINEMHLNIPDYVMLHPTIRKLTVTCIDMVIIGNDLYSYNIEQARGDDGHNLVTVVMHELGIDLDSALDCISDLHDAQVDTFLREFHNAPTWNPPTLDAQVKEYIYGLASWVRGNDEWSFQSERYFGKAGLEVQRTRFVDLLPRHA